MRLGVCYYPEQWPEDRWSEDARLMADTGLSVVRIGEFAWSRMEPRRDGFDWGWLDRAIDTLADAGLEVVLGTPTATPPVWLMRDRPEILSVGPDGRRRAYGSRRHTCPTSRAYRDEALRIVSAMADRYGQHAAVTAWQIDNEPGNHDSARCWCDECQTAFTSWLDARYGGSIDTLNEAWGTVFWSQTYGSFDEVLLPVPTMTGHNPALSLAHLRFASGQAVAGLREQRDLLAERSPDRPTFTNLYLGDVDVDGQAVGRLHGLGAVDSYPHGVSGPEEVGFLMDLTRGSALRAGEGREANGGRGWVVEQQPGGINWTPHNPFVPDGQVRLWGWQAALHGIDTLLFFRWRAARAGQEQYHTGLLRHDGTPDQGLHEARRLAAELQAADPAVLARPPADVALIYDYDDAWAIGIDPHRAGLTHRQLVVAAHAGARRLGFDVDVVPTDADLTGYRVVLAPALHLAVEGRAERLLGAASSGSEVVVGVRSLVKDADDAWVQVPEPAGLAEHVGARVDVWGSSARWSDLDAPAPVVVIGGQRSPAGPWAESFTVQEGADPDVLATWEGAGRDGRPAAVRRDRVTLLGASSAESWAAIIGHLTGRSAGALGTERFLRRDAEVSLDHDHLTASGVPGG